MPQRRTVPRLHKYPSRSDIELASLFWEYPSHRFASATVSLIQPIPILSNGVKVVSLGYYPQTHVKKKPFYLSYGNLFTTIKFLKIEKTPCKSHLHQTIKTWSSYRPFIRACPDRHCQLCQGNASLAVKFFHPQDMFPPMRNPVGRDIIL